MSVSPFRLLFMLLPALLDTSRAAEITGPGAEFFESKIRPVLASACYDCHGPEKQKAGLRLDSRDAVLKGGESGPAIVPGDAEKSLLFQTISGEHPDLKMPKNADALSAVTVSAFREWIQMGAPDPRDKPSTGGDGDWAAAFKLRKQAWFWQPLQNTEPPDVPGVVHPVDCFLRAAQQKAGLSPVERADEATIARRLAFVLTGLPPGSKADRPDAAYVDSLLASPAFGERWARHWMDWLRYADSHGSEGDPAIPHAWQYRDYLIRALNSDIPYWQLVREHIAGDLLPARLSADGSLNEAAIGPAHLRMVFHGFTPTDALDEFVTFTDNQVDVVSKAFLGLTVSCARCHNHKFDAISQEDYTAMFGIFANVRPATVDVRNIQAEAAIRERLRALKTEITHAVMKDWEASLKEFPQRLAAWQPKDDAQKNEAESGGHGALAVWLAVRDKPERGQEFSDALAAAAARGDAALKALTGWEEAAKKSGHAWWSGDAGNLEWSVSGSIDKETPAGLEVSLLTDGDSLTNGLLPPVLCSDRVKPGERAVVASSHFTSKGGRVWIRASGKASGLRFTVANYPRSGLIYPKTGISADQPRWFEFNLDYWKGEAIHLEAWTAPDAPIETGGESGYFHIHEVVYPSDTNLSPPPTGIPLRRFIDVAAEKADSREGVAKAYTTAIRSALSANDKSSKQHSAEFINTFVRAGLLPSAAKDLPTAAPLVAEYRRLAAQLKEPIRAPGVMEGGPGDWPMYARGDHKKPGAPVARRFLSAFDATPYQTKESGRRELAESITGPGGALASRVIVNRLWHHVFGRGIVATTDNFGKLGELPTHPELIDWLAREFQKSGGSVKAMLKLLVTSEAFMAQAAPSPEAAAQDPENKLLTHWTLRRLEAEAIRDAMLSMTGRLEQNSSGPGVDGNASRRSVYVEVIRNALDPFLTVFDAPVPSSTRGKRDATNIPAQALTLMNSPLVQTWARDWASRVSVAVPDEEGRVRQLYRDAFHREPAAVEVAKSLAWMKAGAAAAQELEQQRTQQRTQLEALERARAALAAPIIARLKESRPAAAELPRALAEWTFEGGIESAIPLRLHGGAKIADGALHLNGKDAWASTGPLATTLKARTLEAWVSLTNLDQVGGGVFTVQDLAGDTFDAIVFAENGPRQWLAGSNNFARTQIAQGPQEADAVSRPVHVAITWAADGMIRLYRDGAPYGQPYKSAGPVEFAAGKCMVQFGCRHAEPSGNRLLAGAIHRARLYDRALTPEEVSRTATAEGAIITPGAVLAAMSEPDRRQDEALTREIETLNSAVAGEPVAAMEPLQSLAHALLNTKEFIYLR